MSVYFDSAAIVGARLMQLGQTVSVAESSTGGLISANLLTVSGASSFYVGGSVVYSLKSRHAFLKFDRERTKNLEPLSEAMVMEFARAARNKLDTDWGLAELGAAGPKGTPYGHNPGISVIAVSGPIEASIKIETNSDNREENMLRFAEAALDLFRQSLESIA